MKRILIIAGVAFLVSVAAGAGGRLALAPAPAVEEPTAENGDAATTEAGHGATTETGQGAVTGTGHGDAAPAGASRAAVPAGHGAPESGAGTESAAVPAGDPGGSDAAVPQGRREHAPAGDGERPLEFREMGAILSSMQPKEAGLFLSYLDDDRAAGLLRAMTVADAAAIIGRVPKERGERLRALLLAELSGDK